jgi:hypothetical protein
MIFKRSKIYWMDITLDGVRYRQSLKHDKLANGKKGGEEENPTSRLWVVCQ